MSVILPPPHPQDVFLEGSLKDNYMGFARGGEFTRKYLEM